MTTDRELAVDISKWQDPYKDDLIDEGFKKPIMCIQKASDGRLSYFDNNYSYRTKFIEQRESIESFEIKPMYHWVQTEQGVNEQFDSIMRSMEKGNYDCPALDYESYYNQITQATAFRMRDIANALKAENPDMPLMIYSNQWIFKNLVYWLSAEWLNPHIIWAAGGSKYNQLLVEQPEDDFHIYTIPNLIIEIEQFSADGNQAADEFDFGTSETASIDVNLINIPRDELLAMFGKGEPEEPEQPEIPEVPEQPVCNCDERISEIQHVTDQFILDTCAKIRKTTANAGEELAKQIESEGEDLKDFIETME